MRSIPALTLFGWGFFILNIHEAIAQQQSNESLKGSVLQMNNRHAIPSATVLLTDAKDSLSRYTVATDTSGHFSFFNLPPRLYHITVSSAGFKACHQSITIQPGKSAAPLVVLLAPNNTELKQVVVSAQKNDYIEQQIDKMVVNVGGLAATGGNNAVDILNSTAGVWVDEDGNVSLRGREGVLVYVDDKPVQLSGADLINYLKSLPAAMIDKIELMPNPSSKYDAAGTAIINIRTKKLKAKGLNGNISVGAGTGRYFRSENNGMLNYHANKLNFFVNGSTNDVNGYFLSRRSRIYNYPDAAESYTLVQDVYEISHEINASYKAGVDYDVNKRTSLGITAGGFFSHYREKGNYNNYFFDAAGQKDSSLLSNSRYTTRPLRSTVNFNMRHTFKKAGREISMNVDYLQYHTRQQQTLQSDLYHVPDSLSAIYTLASNNPFRVAIYGARADYSDSIGRRVKIESGVQAVYSIRQTTTRYTDHEGMPELSLNNNFQYKENINAAYINVQAGFKRLTVQAGCRVETTFGDALQYNRALKPDTSFTLRYANAFPTAYVSYKAGRQSKSFLLFSFGKRISRPGYYELDPSSFFFDRNTSNRGNSLLQPDFSTNMELSYTYNHRFTVAITYEQTNGLITKGYLQLGDAFIGVPVNIEKYTEAGINTTWSWQVRPWLLLNLYHDVADRRYKGAVFNTGMYNDDRLITFFHRSNWQFKCKKGWSASLQTFYRTRLLGWQSMLQPLAQVHAGLQKKLSEQATVAVTGRDIFHNWKIRRDINIQYAQVHYLLVNDTQRIHISFSYRFGSAVKNREQKSAIENEAGRL